MYAQILKSNMRVNLIGGEPEGLPIEHPLVICLDITNIPDVKIGMKYNPETNTFYEKPLSEDIAPHEKRSNAYQTLQLISWGESTITVDQANQIYLDYFAEANPKADQIQPLIIEAKAYIRSLYPDEAVI